MQISFRSWIYWGHEVASMAKPTVKLAIEGFIDHAALRRLVKEAGFEPGDAHGFKGKALIDKRIKNYARAAMHEPWIVLRDLDQDSPCAGALRAQLLPKAGPMMCFRIAVRAVESWLMADRDGISKVFGLRLNDLPKTPDDLMRPKVEMLEALINSNKREVRNSMVVRSRAGVLEEGPEYNARLVAFADKLWEPEAGSAHSNSLKKAIVRIDELKRYVSSRSDAV
jgi:hypothetical protein